MRDHSHSSGLHHADKFEASDKSTNIWGRVIEELTLDLDIGTQIAYKIR